MPLPRSLSLSLFFSPTAHRRRPRSTRKHQAIRGRWRAVQAEHGVATRVGMRCGPSDITDHTSGREEQQAAVEHLARASFMWREAACMLAFSCVAGACAPRFPIHLCLSPSSPLLPPVRKKRKGERERRKKKGMKRTFYHSSISPSEPEIDILISSCPPTNLATIKVSASKSLYFRCPPRGDTFGVQEQILTRFNGHKHRVFRERRFIFSLSLSFLR